MKIGGSKDVLEMMTMKMILKSEDAYEHLFLLDSSWSNSMSSINGEFGGIVRIIKENIM